MQMLLSCAKDMMCTPETIQLPLTEPLFLQEARQIAVNMMKYSAEELAQMLKINSALAALNKVRYTQFLEPSALFPAAMAYNGIAYKQLNAEEMNEKDLTFAQQHLWITSFLYGLLRPLDGIKPYRLEGNVRLFEHQDMRMFNYWQPLLTDVLIDSVKADDGVLLNIASGEMKNLFDWKRVKREITVVEPEFYVEKGGKLKTIVVYAKMCRGAMARYVITNKATNIADLTAFNFQDFVYNPAESSSHNMVFILKESF